MGAVSTYMDSTVGPYDNVEDTQVAVLNKSGSTLSSFTLSGPAGFLGFEGDGISNTVGAGGGGTATGAGAPSNANDPSLYGGPQAYFTIGGPGSSGIAGPDFTDTTAFVNLTGGLASGSSTYFSLELSPGTLGAGGITAGGTVPEPTSMALAATGIVTLLGFGWRRRNRSLKA
jgi:hypothetical protein